MKCKSRISEICVLVRVVVSGDRGIFYRIKKEKKEKKEKERRDSNQEERGIGTCDTLHWLLRLLTGKMR